jgi:hypothetical protein
MLAEYIEEQHATLFNRKDGRRNLGLNMSLGGRCFGGAWLASYGVVGSI